MMNVPTANKSLFDEVIDAGLCTFCGACSGSCPYLVPYKGRIVLLDNCTLSDGQCYQYCPRTSTDMDAISQSFFGVPYSGDELGGNRQVLMARSTDANIRDRAQYGGTVTTLISVALSEGIIDSAILSRMSDDKIPFPGMAQSAEEVLQCAGSSFIACPVLEALTGISKDNKERLGIVVIPCQALALAKMKKEPPTDMVSIDNVRLTIGLFCTWALSQDDFYKMLVEKIDLLQVQKFDIPPPPADRFDVYTHSGINSFPLELIRQYIMPGCSYCLDMTAEFTDISVGSVEGVEGWNTVIVRTEVGAELIEMAKGKGKLEIEMLPPQNLAHLKEAAFQKKKRALKEIVNRSGDRSDLLYLKLSEGVVDKLLR